MLSESFLHFIWRYQYFNSTELKLASGESLKIIKPGNHNHLAGPDFKEARIEIDSITWYGSVEIHTKSSEWLIHGHKGDPNYDNVVLHVVWQNDKAVLNEQGSPIPTLELKGLVKPGVLNRYRKLLESTEPVHCSQYLSQIKNITRLSMVERVLVERLETKAASFFQVLEKNGNDWENAAFQWLARGFGFKTNAENMQLLAESLPLKVLLKHSNHLFQVEALLFGQAGLLNVDVKDNYAYQLQKEYSFLKTKYGLKQYLSYNQWHFSKVRPPNYPTIRIAQLAALLVTQPHVFTFFSEMEETKQAINDLDILQSNYWCSHYAIDKPTTKILGGLSKASRENLIINTAVPFLAALAKYKDDTSHLDKALSLLTHLKSENNHITDTWKGIGWNVSSAFDSQGLIQLYNVYCKQKRCIECTIGVSLVRTP